MIDGTVGSPESVGRKVINQRFILDSRSCHGDINQIKGRYNYTVGTTSSKLNRFIFVTCWFTSRLYDYIFLFEGRDMVVTGGSTMVTWYKLIICWVVEINTGTDGDEFRILLIGGETFTIWVGGKSRYRRWGWKRVFTSDTNIISRWRIENNTIFMR